MNTEQRLARAERILLLMVNAGRRERKRMREMDEKIAILIDAQIRNEDRWQETDRRWQETDRRLQETDRKWRETDRRWQEMIRKWDETDLEFRRVGELHRSTDERITRLENAQDSRDEK